MSDIDDDESLRALWRQLEPEKAPDDIAGQVERSLKARGFLHERRYWIWGMAAALLAGGALSLWSLRQLDPPEEETFLIPITVESLHQAASPLSFSGRLLSDYGRFTLVNEPSESQPWRDFEGEVAAHRLKDLEVEISLYPTMRLLDVQAQGDTVQVVVRVREPQP